MYPWINSNFIVNVSRCIKGGNLNTLQSLQAAQKIVHYCLTRQLRNLPATWIESAKKTKKTKDIMIMVFILLQWVPPKCEFSFFAPMFYRPMISILPRNRLCLPTKTHGVHSKFVKLRGRERKSEGEERRGDEFLFP